NTCACRCTFSATVAPSSITHSGPTVADDATWAPGATLALACTPGEGFGQSERSIRAQTRARATDGFSTRRKSCPGFGSPTNPNGSSTTEARVSVTSVLYLGLPRNVRSPAAASDNAASPRTVSVVAPRDSRG